MIDELSSAGDLRDARRAGTTLLRDQLLSISCYSLCPGVRGARKNIGVFQISYLGITDWQIFEWISFGCRGSWFLLLYLWKSYLQVC